MANAHRIDIAATPQDAEATLLALRACGAYNLHDLDYAAKFVRLTGIVPRWINSYNPGEWFVRHGESVATVYAVSEADAINKVRFRFHGYARAEDLPPFAAICPFDIVADAVAASRGVERRRDAEARTTTDLFGRHTISKADALKRLGRMAS